MNKGYKILVEDESTARLEPTIRKLWNIKGSKPIQITNGSKKKTHIFGAVSGKTKITMFANKINSKIFKKFLKKLSKKMGKLVLFLDNAPSHISNETKKYAEKLGIMLQFFPPYSPELNPIEQLWKEMKNNITFKLHSDMDDLKCKIRGYIRRCDFSVDLFKYWS